MTVKLETLENKKVKLTVTVEAEAFNKALDYAFKKVSKEVEIKGFRKGKVPRPVFEQRFGEAALYEEAINFILPVEYSKAIEETKIEPVAQPSIDVDYENIGKDKEFTFYATVVVKPEVTLGDYKGLEVVELETEVTEAEVEAEINKLMDRYAELVIKEEAAVDGDTVVIDYEGFKEAVAFEGGKDTNHSLKIGSHSFIPGFEEKLIGIKANEDRDIDLTFPADYQAEDLAGKDVVFKVHCHEVKARVLPEITEEFIEELEIEGVKTVEELNHDARKKLADKKQTAAKNHLTDTLVERASENATITIPEEMVDAEAEKMLQDAEQTLSQQGLTLDLYLQYTGGDRGGLLNQFKGDAVKRIRYSLTLEAIAKLEGLTAFEEEINQQYEEIAKANNVSVDVVKKAITDTTEIENVITSRKAIDLLVEHAIKKTME
jgi:trigger factor